MVGDESNIQDWSRTFRLAKTTLEAESYTAKDELAAQKVYMKSAREHKTIKEEALSDGFNNEPPGTYQIFKQDLEIDPKIQAENFMNHIGKTFLAIQQDLSKIHGN